MNFNDLMNIASNKQQLNEKKAKTKKTKLGDSNGVSSEAVKGFLARKNAEKAKQKEEEEAARRARIQARIQQEQKDKTKSKKNNAGPTTSSVCNNQKSASSGKDRCNVSTGHQQPIPLHKRGEKDRVAHQRKHAEVKEKSVESTHKNIKTKQKTVKDQSKNVVSKQKDRHKQNVNEKILERESDGNISKKPDKKIRKPVAPALSFQELMNVAKKQADNPDAVLELLERRQVKEPKVDTNEKAKTKDSGIKHEKLKSSKPFATRKTSLEPSKFGKVVAGKRKAEGISKKTDIPMANARVQKCSQKSIPDVGRDTLAKPKQMTIERETISEKRRDVMSNRLNLHQRRYYEEDEDEDELDEFIDDSEAGPDISSYIKDIFGYDRTKFRDREDDIDNMESSFADIQREEAKSSRIAKLEDEIEKLKEAYELQHSQKKRKLKP